ncbi:receptor protein-tyrosine kinase [Plakobranchus ocellatus]|uniref:Receptor protein-tyrosine kinase n=1 Tax=Plakobranchus ocellatus TaxID=259542 RepID=A0AAV4B0K3_9GAST|nr:receptor protein-tyrosine kinase [Plakobranchus ocellatus]
MGWCCSHVETMSYIQVTLGSGVTGQGQEGDALMRLPSASYDQQELLHGITTDAFEDTSNLVEADDYLHPGDSGVRDHRAGSGGQQHFSPHHNGMSSHLHPHHLHNGVHHQHLNGGPGGRMSPPNRQLSNSAMSPSAHMNHDPQSPLTNGAVPDELEWAHHAPPYPYPGSESQQVRLQKKAPPSLVLPVDQDDYLQPEAAAQSINYLDLDGKGYYQNEKSMQPSKPAPNTDISALADITAGEDEPMLDSSSSPLHAKTTSNSSINNNNTKHGQYTNQPSKGSGLFSWPSPVQLSGPPFAVENPDYFEDEIKAPVRDNFRVVEGAEDDDEVWEAQSPASHGTKNGYHPVANSCTSPSHMPHLSMSHPVNTKVMYNGGRSLRNSESNV